MLPSKASLKRGRSCEEAEMITSSITSLQRSRSLPPVSGSYHSDNYKVPLQNQALLSSSMMPHYPSAFPTVAATAPSAPGGGHKRPRPGGRGGRGGGPAPPPGHPSPPPPPGGGGAAGVWWVLGGRPGGGGRRPWSSAAAAAAAAARLAKTTPKAFRAKVVAPTAPLPPALAGLHELLRRLAGEPTGGGGGGGAGQRWVAAAASGAGGDPHGAALLDDFCGLSKKDQAKRLREFENEALKLSLDEDTELQRGRLLQILN